MIPNTGKAKWLLPLIKRSIKNYPPGTNDRWASPEAFNCRCFDLDRHGIKLFIHRQNCHFPGARKHRQVLWLLHLTNEFFPLYDHIFDPFTSKVCYWNYFFIKDLIQFISTQRMDCKIIVSDFEFQSLYYVHFRTNTLWKGMNPLILSALD